MANWNLSVELRGGGSNLAAELRRSATHARTLAAAAKDAQSEVRGLGNASQAATGHLQTLGRESTTARLRIVQLGKASETAEGHVSRLGTSALTATANLTRMAGEARDAAKDLRELAAAAALADTQLRATVDDIRISVTVDDQTAPGVLEVRDAVDALQSLSPVQLTAIMDDQTGPGVTDVRAAVTALQSLSPVELSVLLDDQTGTGVAALRAALTELQALSPVQLNATLDDRTGTGVREVRDAVDALQALSPVRLGATMDDRTAPGVREVRDAVDAVRSLGPVRLGVVFDGDPAQIALTATAMRDLRNNSQNAGTALGGMAPNAAAAVAAFQLLESAAQSLSNELRILRARASATADALDDLRNQALTAAGGLGALSTSADSSGTRLAALSTHARTLRTDLTGLNGSLTTVGGNLGGLNGSLGTVSSSANSASDSTMDLMGAIVALATALVPVAAAAVPIAAALTGAGLAVGVFGAAVGGQIAALAEATEAQKKYDEAVREHGKTSAEAATAEKELLRQMADMPPATREASAGFSALKDDYQAFSDSLADDTMPVFTKSFAVLRDMMPSFAPLARGAANELDRLVTIAAGGVASPGFDAFMEKLTKFSVAALREGVDQLIALSRAANDFAQGGGFDEFMDYARENGPLVADTLKNLALAMINLVEGSADVGVTMLGVVNSLAKLVNALPPEFIGILIQGYAAFKLFALGAAAVSAVTGAAATAQVAAFVRSARFGGIVAATGGVVQGMSAMSKGVGIAALAFAAFYAGQQIGQAFWSKTPLQADQVADAFSNLAKSGKLAGLDLNDLADSFVRISQDTGWTDTVYDYGTFHSNTEWKKAAGDIDAFDTQLADLVGSDNADLAKEGYAQLSAVLKEQGYSVDEIKKKFPEYSKALAAAKLDAAAAARSVGLFGEQAASTTAKIDAQKASTDGLRQSIVALNDVNRAALGGMVGFEAAIDATAKAAKENAKSLKMVNGELDLNSPTAQAAATALQDLATKTDGAATSARDSGKSWEYVNGIYAQGREEFLKSADVMGLTRDQAIQLANSIQDIPHQKSVILEMRTEDAVAGLTSVIDAIKRTPDAKSVTVKALTGDAVLQLESLGFKVTQMPDGTFTVSAATGVASANVAAVQAARDGLKDKSITLSTQTQDAILSLQGVQDKLRATKGKSVTVSALTTAAQRALTDLGFNVTHMKDGTVQVSIPTGTPKGAVRSIQGAIDGMHGKSIVITTTRHYINITENRVINTGKGGRGPNAGGQANGSILDFYADGGMRRGGVRYFADGSENHVAQIAAAGDWRVWAEPETQGEAYIPLAPSKRARSRDIAEETVKRLGGQGIVWGKQDAMAQPSAFAAGGFSAGEPEARGKGYTPLGASQRLLVKRVLGDVRGYAAGYADLASTRPVVVVKQAGDTHVNVTAVRSEATASDIGSQVGRSVRRASRGGVAARAGH